MRSNRCGGDLYLLDWGRPIVRKAGRRNKFRIIGNLSPQIGELHEFAD